MGSWFIDDKESDTDNISQPVDNSLRGPHGSVKSSVTAVTADYCENCKAETAHNLYDDGLKECKVCRQ